MNVTVRLRPLATTRADLIVVGSFEGSGARRRPGPGLDRGAQRAISGVIERGDFHGKPGEIVVLYPDRGRPRLLLVGLGPATALTPQRVRVAAGQAIRRARELGVRSVASEVLGAAALDPAVAAQATAEGLVLGHYRFGTYRTERGPAAVHSAIVCARDAKPAPHLRTAVARGVAWAEAACVARDLANTPGQDLVPEQLAARAREIGRAAGARVQVLGVAQMERLGMGGVLAVGRGSVHEPRFVILDRPASGRTTRARDTVVVIGKGITFDTGGISLKPRENMHRMKMDMAGAAAVLGMFSALSKLALPFRLVGLIASAENMPGSRAFKPGDVIRALDGTTVEITNTDAEGRLVLADAIGYARRFAPAAVVDLATLTGAVRLALGTRAAGLFTDDDALADELIAAGAAAGERLWRLPCWDDYAPDLRSDTADLVNSAGAEGGASLAAVFLKRFARGMRWAHLDIAGTASSTIETPLDPRGATGFGVRLLLEWLSRRASASASPRP
jgi:leucyl aminopeptidase